MIDEIQNIKVGRKELAEIFGIAEKYVNELHKDHGMPKAGHNEYPLIECIKWHKNYQDEIHAKEIQKIKADKPQDELARNNARLRELEIEREEGALTYIEDIEAPMFNLIGMIIQQMDAWPTNCSQKVADESDPIKCLEILEEQKNKTRTKIASLSESEIQQITTKRA